MNHFKLEQMDLEVREVEPVKRQRCRTKLDCYRAELKRLTLEYIKARSIKQSALGYDSAEEINDVRISAAQKQRLLDNSETLERGGRKLEEGYRVVIETQEIGNQVLQNLNEQRETIQRSRGRVSTGNYLYHNLCSNQHTLCTNESLSMILSTYCKCFC